jgi:hypothetical protein
MLRLAGMFHSHLGHQPLVPRCSCAEPFFIVTLPRQAFSGPKRENADTLLVSAESRS